MLVTAGAMFTDAARRFADRPALGDGTSCQELDGIVGRVAAGLAALGLAPGERVAEAGVVGAPDERRGQILVAYVVAVAGRTPEPEALREALLERLAPYKVPRVIWIVDALELIGQQTEVTG